MQLLAQQAAAIAERVTNRSLEDWESIYKNRRVQARREGKVSLDHIIFLSEAHKTISTYGIEFEDLELVLVTREGGYEKNPHVAAENAANGDDPDPRDIPEVDNPSDYLWRRYDDGRRQNPQRYQERCTSFFAYRIKAESFGRLFPLV